MREESKEPCCAEMMDRLMSDKNSGETCPMSRMCRGMMKKANPGLFMAIPGIALLFFGALLFLKPVLFVWFVAGASILMGIGMLVAAVLARRFLNRPRAA